MTCTAAELAQYLEAKIEGDPHVPLAGVASPERARAEDLIYVQSARHAALAVHSAARCAIAPRETRLAADKTIIQAANPKLAFAKAAAWLLQKSGPAPGIHASAVVSASAKVAPSASIGPCVVIEDEVEIGDATAIGAFCFLGRGAHVGEHCRLHPRVTLYAGVRLGHRVELHSGVVLGADGFGYVFGEGRHWKFPQIGGVEIGDDVEIGANTTIDRGSLDDTRIGPGVKIDNLVQVAHNVRIGQDSVIAAQTGISGSCTLGANVVAGGQVGIGDHCTIEDGAMLGGQAGILNGKTIRAGQIVWGTPARPLAKFKEQFALASRLPDFAARLRKLEQSRAED
jgi:UDP-3-O-[3-hydroxymyristoyl] glucosamine N-acyltransferase